MCKGNLSWVSLARSVTRPQATGFALQNRTNKKTRRSVSFFVLVRPTGFEPAAYRVGVCHSIQLSYGRIFGCRLQLYYYTTFGRQCKENFCFQIVKKLTSW